VKTVGGTSLDTDESEQVVSKPKPTNFVLDVEPEDLLTSLYTQIEKITGLTKGQQRLIYRGRLLCDLSSGRIKDVDGLGDGQTIHLVPKRIEADATENENASSSNTSENTLLPVSSDEAADNAVGSASAGILAALLGLGSSSSSNNEDENNEDEADVEAIFPLPRPRSTRLSTRRRATNVYRRYASDPRYPEPGPIEPVRQSLMTLHTMVGSKAQNFDGMESKQRKNYAHARRRWYQGQWLDVRDTVNQWLEATVVEIVSPDEILQSVELRSDGETQSLTLCPSTDPAISADDMDGRRKLLLECADDKFDRTLSDLNNDNNLVGFRERDNNTHVQLLLVHYNGWPRRWDEWIRSDSERIRPFRTRSKHVLSENSRHVCPTPNSAFENAPDTYITHEDDEIDRLALLPELHRSIRSIHDLFGESIQPSEKDNLQVKTLTLEEQLDLARAVNKLQSDRLNKIREMFDDSTAGAPKFDDEIDLTHLDRSSQQKINLLLQEAREKVRSEKGRAESESELPWLSYEEDTKPNAGDDDESNTHENDGSSLNSQDLRNFDKQKLEALAPLLDRLGRALIDAAPHVAAVAESIPEKKPSSVETESEEPAGGSPNRLFPIQEETPPITPTTDETDMPPLMRRVDSEVSDDGDEVNPDYVDFVNGFIQAARNDAPTRSGGRRGSGEGSLGSSLFSALLASGNSDGGDDDEDSRNSGGRSGPRIVRVGGSGGNGGSGSGNGGGGGIDIHIHAIVTGGGGGGGIAGIGLEGLGGLGGLLGPPPNAIVLNNSSTSAESRGGNTPVSIIPTIPSADEEEQGLFSDLYSDNPQPEGNNLTGSWNDDVAIMDDSNDVDDYVDQEEISPSSTTVNDESGLGDTNTRIPPTTETNRDRVYSAPSHPSSIESLTSTSVMQNESRTYNDITDNRRPRSTPHESRRSSNSLGRLFRRVLTRRSSSNT